MWNHLYFIRNDKEYREVIINKDTYYIKGMTSAYGGKYHTNPNAYIKKKCFVMDGENVLIMSI